MPTNPIAADTTNLAVNILKDQNLFLGRIASRDDKSKGELVKQLIHDGLMLRDPELAARWDSIKARRYTQAVALCFAGALVIWQSLIGSIDIRRSSTRVRIPRKEQIA
jgi:hypothetical protein